RVVLHQNDSSCLDRHVRSRANSDADRRRRQRRCVVYPIPYHGHPAALLLESLDRCSLVPRQYLGADFIDAERTRHCLGSGPAITMRPPTVACTPWPGTASKWEGGSTTSARRLAASTTAVASGCSDCASAAAASRRISASSTPAAGMTSVTDGRPSVSVPVLSKMTVSTWAAA